MLTSFATFWSITCRLSIDCKRVFSYMQVLDHSQDYRRSTSPLSTSWAEKSSPLTQRHYHPSSKDIKCSLLCRFAASTSQSWSACWLIFPSLKNTRKLDWSISSFSAAKAWTIAYDSWTKTTYNRNNWEASSLAAGTNWTRIFWSSRRLTSRRMQFLRQ